MFKTTSIVKNASSAMPSDLKYENRWRVLNVFRDGNEYTANEVAAITGISRQTTMKAIHFFCDTGLLSSLGKGDSTVIGGKKPEYFAFCRRSYLICITMWHGTINLTLFDLVRHKLDYEEHPAEKDIFRRMFPASRDLCKRVPEKKRIKSGRYIWGRTFDSGNCGL